SVATVGAVRPRERLRAWHAGLEQARQQAVFALDAVGHEPAAHGVEQAATPVHLDDRAPAVGRRLGPDEGFFFGLEEGLVRVTLPRGHQAAPSLTISANRWPEATRLSGGAATSRPPSSCASSAT